MRRGESTHNADTDHFAAYHHPYQDVKQLVSGHHEELSRRHLDQQQVLPGSPSRSAPTHFQPRDQVPDDRHVPQEEDDKEEDAGGDDGVRLCRAVLAVTVVGRR
jgi:hypothetical protein